MKKHDYIPRKVKIVERKSLSPDSVLLKIKFLDKKPFHFVPGQFVMVSVSGFGEIPIGIASAPSEKSYVDIAVRVSGSTSRKICSLALGDELGINGPFGNGFPIAKTNKRNVVIISGGIGIFPLRSLIHHIGSQKKSKSLTIMNGARNEDLLLFQDEYKDWRKFSKVELTVDKCGPDWNSCVGMITKLFERTKIKRGSVIIVCGPPIMYKSVIKFYAGKSVADEDIYFSLERRMACGIGKCQHCTCGKKYVCLDGPVFSYKDIKYNPEAFL